MAKQRKMAEKKPTKKKQATPKRKERQVMLPPAPAIRVNKALSFKTPELLKSQQKKPANQDPDAQPSWTPEREVDYLQQRLATAREGLARHQNEVWAHEALIKTLEDSLETAMGELLVDDPVPSTKRSNR